MSSQLDSALSKLLPAEKMAEIDMWIAKYPPSERQSAVMAALRIVQESLGFLTEERMDAVASYLDMPAIAVYEVATFYTMYEHAPCGRHLISVCTNISCQLNGSARIMSHLEETLGISSGETTKDARFTLRPAECLGACVGAPMMQVDKDYHECLTTSKLQDILNQYE